VIRNFEGLSKRHGIEIGMEHQTTKKGEVLMDPNLETKVAVVTGGSRGNGLAIA